MGGLFGGDVKTPPPPKPQRMPNETDPDVLAAAQRTRQAALQRRGRLSTILTDQTRETAGTDTYSRKTLG